MPENFIYHRLIFTICLLLATNAFSQNPNTHPSTAVFQRISEPNEKAFTLLIPKSWQVEGGIVRVNPLAQGGPAQSVAAKLDFAVKKDRSGSVMTRWLPDVLFYDARHSPAGQMGLFPPGSNYQGMTVYPLMSAVDFIRQIAFPYAHPQASDIRIVEHKQLPKLARQYQQRMRAMVPMIDYSYDAGMMIVQYRENGTAYKEKIMAVVENWGQMGAGMWGNKETFFMRMPAGEFGQWDAVFSIIQSSVKISLEWLRGELRGQVQRNEIMIRTQQDMQRIERDIANHRSQTNAEIHNDMFLTLTEQEEYVNPYTKEVEMGSNQWRHRWISEGGDVIYSDREEYDPNTDINLNRSDFKRTPMRPR